MELIIVFLIFVAGAFFLGYAIGESKGFYKGYDQCLFEERRKKYFGK